MAEDFVRTYQVKMEAIDEVGTPLFKRETQEGAGWTAFHKKIVIPGSTVVQEVMDVPAGDMLIVKTTGSLIIRLDGLATEQVACNSFAIIDKPFGFIDITQIHDDGGSIVEFTSLTKV
jgi:hypothetical protein